MAQACRDAKSCVSRDTKAYFHTIETCGYIDEYSLGRRKILRLYFYRQRWNAWTSVMVGAHDEKNTEKGGLY